MAKGKVFIVDAKERRARGVWQSPECREIDVEVD